MDAPKVGHVIRYSYLWWNEYRRGQEEGVKERPACVILNRVIQDGETMVYVLPITHTPPTLPEDGIAIPIATKRRLGLDGQPSWIIMTEFNKFIWPGYDVRVLDNGNYSYGILPSLLISKVLASVKEHARGKTLKTVGRDA